MRRAALTNAASARHGRRTARTVWHSAARAEDPTRHVWRIGQPLHLVSHSRKEGVPTEVPQHAQEGLAARTVNEQDGDRRMLWQLPGSLHSTRYIIRSLGVCIVTTRATDNHHANRPLLRRNRGEEIRPVCTAVRVRAVVQRVYSGVAPEAENPATRPGVLEAVGRRACGSLER